MRLDPRVIQAVLTDEQQRLYMTNAWFRTGVDTLMADWLTIMLAGLEATAQEKQQEFEGRVREIESADFAFPEGTSIDRVETTIHYELPETTRR